MQKPLRGGHQDRSADALSRDIAQCDRQTILIKRHNIKKITAYELAGAAFAGVDWARAGPKDKAKRANTKTTIRTL